MQSKENEIRFLPKSEQNLSIAFFPLFFSWVLAMPFEGPLFYAVSAEHGFHPGSLIMAAVFAQFAGLVLSGFVIKTVHIAKHLFLFSITWCILATTVFFFPPGALWSIALVSSAFLAGMCIAAWGLYFKYFTSTTQRTKTISNVMVISTGNMILLNMTAILISPRASLGLSMLLLAFALGFAVKLPVIAVRQNSVHLSPSAPETARLPYERAALARDMVETATGIPAGSFQGENSTFSILGIRKTTRNNWMPFLNLYLFILIIMINAGLMYCVIGPAFSHLQWLVSWYWPIPFIFAMFLAAYLTKKGSRFFILYIGIAMSGFSFIAFIVLDRSAGSYLLIDTLLRGACGFIDLFWWSMIGEMLDFSRSPVKIMGLGLSTNMLGILLGELIGKAMNTWPVQHPSLVAITVLFACLIILPLVDKQLSVILKNYDLLTELMRIPAMEWQQEDDADDGAAEEAEKAEGSGSQALYPDFQLTGRESEITALLQKGMTYKMIAAELHLSENTIKTHIKNIYSKFNVQSRIELVTLLHEKERA